MAVRCIVSIPFKHIDGQCVTDVPACASVQVHARNSRCDLLIEGFIYAA